MIDFDELVPAPIELFGGGADIHDVKIGSVFRRVVRDTPTEGLRVAVIGFPVDDGVRRNHGRPGAAQAPGAVRRVLARLNARDAFRRAIPGGVVGDFGNVAPRASLEESQERAARIVAALLGQGLAVVLLGGGHETARCHGEALLALPGRSHLLNVDPHLDVRESADNRPTSGNPFRLALEAARGRLRYTAVGARPEFNAAAYAEYVLTRGGTICWSDGRADWQASDALARELALGHEPNAGVSLDIDAVESGSAPGSSAASPTGISAHEFVACARAAGGDPRVRMLEVSEFAPPYDRDGQTARVAALAVQAFLFAGGGAARL
ncbi:MAG: formimidoylglutamase [Candidatus Sumerlaeia bacterium]|nr:formimidoylglutamase [Candidatus Sumerlaeia bacterium]